MMTTFKPLPYMGALNKKTGEYTCPKLSNKKEEYICPECRKDLILCQGEIRAYHFRHISDDKIPCNYYNKPSESQIHKDAKMLLKQLLDKRIPITLIRPCKLCKDIEEYEIPEIIESSSIKTEHRFNYNNTAKIADVAYIDNNDIVCIFEIYHTHKTMMENRPEPWFEIDAGKLLSTVNNSSSSDVRIDCIRRMTCGTCISREKNNIKQEKIAGINYALLNISSIRESRHVSSDDDADVYRSMRYSKQCQNHEESLLSQLSLIENDIEFVLGNNVVSMEHPFTKTKIRRSLVNGKTFYKGKWTNKITFEMMLAWFRCSNIEEGAAFEYMISMI